MQRSLSAPRDFLERLVLCEVESSLLKLLIGGTSTPRSASTMTAHIVSRKEGPALEVVRSVIVVRQEPRCSRPRFRPGPKEGSGTGRATVPPSARHRDFAFLELLGAATGGAFFALDGAAAFAFLAPGTGAAAAGAAAASAILRFFGLPAGVGGADVAIVPDADGREAKHVIHSR